MTGWEEKPTATRWAMCTTSPIRCGSKVTTSSSMEMGRPMISCSSSPTDSKQNTMQSMSTKTKFPTTLLGTFALALCSAGLGRVAAQEIDPETKARVERFEKGPTTIDVSQYPDGLKENYEVFSTKCAQCHK